MLFLTLHSSQYIYPQPHLHPRPHHHFHPHPHPHQPFHPHLNPAPHFQQILSLLSLHGRSLFETRGCGLLLSSGDRSHFTQLTTDPPPTLHPPSPPPRLIPSPSPPSSTCNPQNSQIKSTLPKYEKSPPSFSNSPSSPSSTYNPQNYLNETERQILLFQSSKKGRLPNSSCHLPKSAAPWGRLATRKTNTLGRQKAKQHLKSDLENVHDER